MTRTRLTLAASALIAAGAVALRILLELYGYGVQLVEIANGTLSGTISVGELLSEIFLTALDGVTLGLGVFLALRFVFAPIDAESTWRQTVTTGILATALGTVTEFVYSLAYDVVSVVGFGPHPLGYSLDPSFQAMNIHFDFISAIGDALTRFVGLLPVAVLGCVVLRIWMASHPETHESGDGEIDVAEQAR